MNITLEDLYLKAKSSNTQGQFIELLNTLLPITIDHKIFSLIVVKCTQFKMNDNKDFIRISKTFFTKFPLESFEVIRDYFLNVSQNKRQLEYINLDDLSGALFLVDQYVSKEFLQVLQLQKQDMDGLLIQLFQLPNLVRNIFKEKMLQYEEQFYLTLIDNLIDNQLNTAIMERLVDKLMLVGQVNLLVKSLYKSKKFDFLEIIMSQLIYANKLLQSLIIKFIDESDTSISNLLIQPLQVELKIIFVNVVNSAHLDTNKYHILGDIIKDSCNKQMIQEILLELVIKWSDQEFTKFASKRIQISINFFEILDTTNIIAVLLDQTQQQTFKKLDTLIQLINDGVQSRLNFFQNFSYIRISGLVIWRHFVKFLDIPSPQNDTEDLNIELDIPEFLISDEQEKTLEKQIIPEEITEFLQIKKDIEEEYISLDYTLDDSNIEGLPKSIYDSLIALQNGNSQRIESALKHLPYLIRKNLSDVQIYAEQLTNLLLKIHLDDGWKHDYDQSRKDILVSLLIVTTKITANDECSMGEKHLILLTLIESVDELSNNPQKYPVEKFDEYPEEINQTFFFQKVSTKYYSIEDGQDEEKLSQKRKARIDEKSRRWGHTRKLHEQKSLTRQDLLITRQLKNETYQNRFHGLLMYIFFPVIIHAQTKLRLVLTREPLFLTHFFQMCTKMLDCAKFSFDLYKMIGECADLTALIKQNKNIQVLKSKLQLWLKVSFLIKQEVIHQHPLLLEKIMKLLETFNCHEVREMHDQQTRTILSLIFENFKNILQIKLE